MISDSLQVAKANLHICFGENRIKCTVASDSNDQQKKRECLIVLVRRQKYSV